MFITSKTHDKRLGFAQETLSSAWINQSDRLLKKNCNVT